MSGVPRRRLWERQYLNTDFLCSNSARIWSALGSPDSHASSSLTDLTSFKDTVSSALIIHYETGELTSMVKRKAVPQHTMDAQEEV
jgi:hypothetical protein